MRYSTRKMQPRDIPQVTEIEMEAFPCMEPVTNFERELKNGVAHYIVADEEPDITGFTGFWLLATEAHIVNIAVRQTHRRQGIGEKLLIKLIEATLAKGAEVITLEVRISDDKAKSLYIKYGFKEEGVRRGYYLNNREDAVIMTLRGLASPEFNSRLKELKEAHSARWG